MPDFLTSLNVKTGRWWFAALLFLCTTLFFYHNTVYSKFLFDWNTWMLHYMARGWGGFASCWGDQSIRWGYHLLNMVQWKMFSLDARGWYLTAVSLHAANAVLLTALAYSTLRITSLRHPFIISALSGFVWLISPYHSETVVWGATIHFLALTFLMLLGLILFLRYAETRRSFYALGVYLCYVCALFTFEAFLPFVGLLIILWLATRDTSLNRLPAAGFAKWLVAPLVCSIVLYFAVNKWRIGSWVGHYGEASHLNTDLFLIIPNFSKYLLKLLYAPLFFSFSQRDAVYAFLESKGSVVAGFILYGLLFVFLLWKLFKGTPTARVLAAWFFLFCAALVPVINLYFMYYKDIEQDRYVYIASSFFYVALTGAFFHLFRKWAALPFTLSLLISIYFLQRNNECWHQSGRIATSLMNSFRWQDAERIFVLLTPDDYNGAYCMRSMPNSTLSEMLRVQRRIDVDEKLFEVYQTNLTTPQDSAVCEVIDSATLQIKLLGGGWLWRNSFGATDIKTEHFAATLNPHYPAFTVRFHQRRPGDVYIYSVNDQWIEVKLF